VGSAVGIVVGSSVGISVGDSVGTADGTVVGDTVVGTADGAVVGVTVVGTVDGFALGASVVGAAVVGETAALVGVAVGAPEIEGGTEMLSRPSMRDSAPQELEP
jgi:hypothetical protein